MKIMYINLDEEEIKMKFCTSCGNQLQDNAQVCPKCGQRVVGLNQGAGFMKGPMNDGPVIMDGPVGMYARTKSKIDNIFSALIYDKTTGSMMEFSLWCSVCLGVLLLFLATILTGDKDINSRYTDGFRLLWLFTMLLSCGLGAAMVFRKIKPIMLFGAQIGLQFIMLIPYYCTMAGRIDDCGADVPGLVIAVFILQMLTVLGIITCSSIHFFTNMNLGKIISILSIVYSGLLFVLIFFTYFLPYVETYGNRKKYLYQGRDWLNGWSASCFWLGSIAFLIISAAITIYTVLFFKGVIDNRKNKIYVLSSGAGMSSQVMPAIQCMTGNYPGQVFYLQNMEFSIGSQQGVNLVISDPHVSRTHCTIRFNTAAGMYEVRDLSTNGVYMLNGFRLQKGVYTPLQRGTVLCFGSVNQQYKLL